MGYVKRPRFFDPLDLEVIDRVYEAAWAQLQASAPFLDQERDREKRDALRKHLFEVAGSHRVEFDDLYELVMASMPRGLPQSAGHREPEVSRAPAEADV